MLIRLYRAKVFALASLLVLWLLGVLWLQGGQAGNDGFELLWSCGLRGEDCRILSGSAGGVFLLSGPPNRRSLARLGDTAEFQWQLELPGLPGQNYLFILERDGNTYVPLINGQLLAIDGQGRILWHFRPDPTSYSGPDPAADSPPASLYTNSGLLLYGLDPQGSLCWTRLSPFNSTNPPLNPNIMLAGEPRYLLCHFGDTRLLHPDGNISKVEVGGGQAGKGLGMIVNGGAADEARLLGTFGEDGLLFLRGAEFVLMRGEETTLFQLEPVAGKIIRGSYSFTDAAGEFRCLLPMGQALHVLDDSCTEVWQYPLWERSLLSVEPCGSGVQLQLAATDPLTASLWRCADLHPALQRGLQASASPGSGKGRSRLERQLEYLQAGNVEATLPLGQAECSVQADGERIYILRDERRLECYGLAGQP